MKWLKLKNKIVDCVKKLHRGKNNIFYYEDKLDDLNNYRLFSRSHIKFSSKEKYI